MRQTQTQRECGAEMNYESLTNSWKCKECGHTTAGEKLGERYDERLRFVGAT
jgi:ribosomal protein L37AE/L43A